MEKKMHGFRARLDYWLKHSYAVERLFNVTASITLRIIGKFIAVDDKMILFSAHTRKYNDSPRAIYEYMLTLPQYSDFKYVWALEDSESVYVPGDAIKIKADTWAYFKTALKAKYWITCVNIERSLHFKKKNQRYLNTWHGTAFNAIGNAAGGRKDYDFSNIDLFCYESEFQKQIYIKDMLVREEALIPTGLPRNDTLYGVTKENIDAIKDKLSLPKDKKVLLYTPTWRDSEDKGATYAIKPPMNIDYWEKELKDNYIILFRTHAYTNKLLGIQFNEFVRDFTNYPNINDLFKVADVLISDYSSCITDYSILERPIICFAYDYETYKAKRGLNIDFRTEMPSGVLETEKEVVNFIKTMDYNEQCRLTRDMIKNKFTYIGGYATETCVKELFSK